MLRPGPLLSRCPRRPCASSPCERHRSEEPGRCCAGYRCRPRGQGRRRDIRVSSCPRLCAAVCGTNVAFSLHVATAVNLYHRGAMGRSASGHHSLSGRRAATLLRPSYWAMGWSPGLVSWPRALTEGSQVVAVKASLPYSQTRSIAGVPGDVFGTALSLGPLHCRPVALWLPLVGAP